MKTVERHNPRTESTLKPAFSCSTQTRVLTTPFLAVTSNLCAVNVTA